ncbi:DNA helicase [Leptospira johnsonii]|uniref:DNA helicase n=1 Tax=Leptospira johnsonii TaxID=1917820 RepID=A0A2P2CZR9_9LEPT|nr:DNA helicase [Leptospira johnsonii]
MSTAFKILNKYDPLKKEKPMVESITITMEDFSTNFQVPYSKDNKNAKGIWAKRRM